MHKPQALIKLNACALQDTHPACAYKKRQMMKK